MCTQIANNASKLHVAIIMDGNGRWAEQRGLSRLAGHRAGMEAVRNIVSGCHDLNIQNLTLYAFSTENWQRPATEIDGLMGLFRTYMKREINELVKKGVRIRFLGDRSRFEKSFQETMKSAEARTIHNTLFNVNVAMNYGGRHDITHAMQDIARKVKQGLLLPENIDETCIEQHLYTHDLPDPDLLIRTSGEIRLSNFLLWQLAYTEMVFVEKHWPDFALADFTQAVQQYRNRKRRFGALEAAIA